MLLRCIRPISLQGLSNATGGRVRIIIINDMAENVRFIKAVILILICLLPVTAIADEARLSDIRINNTRDDLLVYLNMEGAFNDKIKKAIMSGVPATFTYYIDLYQGRNFWFDKKVTDTHIDHTLKYDSLKKEFNIRRSWEKKPIVTQSFEDARVLMTQIDSLKIISLSQLQKGIRYQIRAKAKLSRLPLPFYLHYIVSFVSFWDTGTDWYTIDFIY